MRPNLNPVLSRSSVVTTSPARGCCVSREERGGLRLTFVAVAQVFPHPRDIARQKYFEIDLASAWVPDRHRTQSRPTADDSNAWPSQFHTVDFDRAAADLR